MPKFDKPFTETYTDAGIIYKLSGRIDGCNVDLVAKVFNNNYSQAVSPLASPVLDIASSGIERLDKCDNSYWFLAWP